MEEQAMVSAEFASFPKIARFSREVIITEKIDGTNAQILIGDSGEFLTGSRNRWITPEQDNYGFSRWAHENKEELLKLGPGRHFGEWWGCGIQRNYGLKEKRWSLFNVTRWCLHGHEPQIIPSNNPKEPPKIQSVLPACVGLVPVLWRGLFDLAQIQEQIDALAANGSVAAPGFMQPEGIVIFHTANGVCFKKTIVGDDGHKSVQQ